MKFFIIIKGKSERLSNKNFLDLGGIPVYKHLLNELKTEDVYIDTDSDTIFNECKTLSKVTCYKRDTKHIELENNIEYAVSPVLLMIENFLHKYVQDENEVIITPHVTSPYITLKTMLEATQMLSEYDTVCACTEHKEFTYFKGEAVNFNPNVVSKTQDLEPVVMGNGAFFIFTKKEFMKNKNRTSENNYFYPITFPESIEIDTLNDFRLAEMYELS
jgi:CMP-N-acetylneuraminic acid synthetase|tara:strand:- start:862 stop:1512 length:651 start_codon:yes stop_codon:yes gene_type:complete